MSGGPNAAACARFLGDRLRGCAIVSGPAPPDPTVSDDGMLRANLIGRKLLRAAPRVAPRVLAPLAERVLRAGQRRPERSVAYMQKSLPAADAAILARPEVQEALLADFARPLAATAGRAAVQDFTLEVGDWGFALRDIPTRVHVWHGDEDRNVPIVNGLRQAETIPDSVLHRVPGAGHMLVYEHITEILSTIAS